MLRKTLLPMCLSVVLMSAGSLPVQAEIAPKDFEEAMKKFLATDSGKEALGSTIENYFREKQQEAQKQQAKMAEAQMEEQFKNPVKLEIGDSPVIGPKDAKVTIIEFSDFQCPYCKRGHDTMAEVLKAYPKDVKIAFKHMPLPFHKDADPAARAAFAAYKQGKFWEYHDALFENQQKLSSENLLEYAKNLKLDIEKFKKDMESQAAKDAVKADTELGQKNGIQGTPGFFVNGVAVKGAYPVDHFKTIIDRWISGNTSKKAA